MKHYKAILGHGLSNELAEIIFSVSSPLLFEQELELAMGRNGYGRYWYLVSHLEFKPGRGGKRPGTGGKREGSGRKKGSGRWEGRETKTVRVPLDIASGLDELIEARSRLAGILAAWDAQVESAKESSVTSSHPRTYDKALTLISELETEILSMPIIV